MRNRQRKKRWLYILGIIGTVVMLSTVYFYSKQMKKVEGKEQEIIPYNVGQLSQECKSGSNFFLTGYIDAKNSKKITIDPQKGTVGEVFVKEGDPVTKNQKLFVYKNEDGEFELKEAELELQNQQKLLMQKRSDARTKWTQYHKQKENLTKATIKYNQAAADDKTTIYEEKKSLEAEVSQLLMEATLADSEITSAEIEESKCYLAIENVHKKNERSIVYSDIDGVIKKLDGDQLEKRNEEKTQEAFMEIVDSSQFYVKGMVDEFHKEKLQIDQPVKVIDREDENKTWTGKIVRIGHLGSEGEKNEEDSKEENPNLTKYPYKVLLNPTDAPPIVGKHVYVQIENIQQESSLMLPTEYVLTDKTNAYIWKVINKKIKRVSVEIGEKNAQRGVVEIKKGLNEKDSIVYPFPKLKENMEVGNLVKIDELK